MKKITLLVSALVLTAATSFADSGTIGTISWKIENDTLTVSGTGTIPNQTFDLMFGFSHVVINEGITGIGSSVWYHTGENILTYDIPASVTILDRDALYGNINVQKITVHWTEDIPEMIYHLNINTYEDDFDFSAITLSVPYGVAADRYRNAAGWQDFNIVSRTDPDPEPTGINEVSETKNITGYYSITGKKLDTAPDSGIYIIKYDNGKAEKVVK